LFKLYVYFTGHALAVLLSIMLPSSWCACAIFDNGLVLSRCHGSVTDVPNGPLPFLSELVALVLGSSCCRELCIVVVTVTLLGVVRAGGVRVLRIVLFFHQLHVSACQQASPVRKAPCRLPDLMWHALAG
jgi:hypothetical protein